jgi:hypothetical protein
VDDERDNSRKRRANSLFHIISPTSDEIGNRRQVSWSEPGLLSCPQPFPTNNIIFHSAVKICFWVTRRGQESKWGTGDTSRESSNPPGGAVAPTRWDFDTVSDVASPLLLYIVSDPMVAEYLQFVFTLVLVIAHLLVVNLSFLCNRRKRVAIASIDKDPRQKPTPKSVSSSSSFPAIHTGA